MSDQLNLRPGIDSRAHRKFFEIIRKKVQEIYGSRVLNYTCWNGTLRRCELQNGIHSSFNGSPHFAIIFEEVQANSELRWHGCLSSLDNTRHRQSLLEDYYLAVACQKYGADKSVLLLLIEWVHTK